MSAKEPVASRSWPRPTPRLSTAYARLLDAGTLRVPIQASYRLEQAAEALAGLTATHTQGKLAITFD